VLTKRLRLEDSLIQAHAYCALATACAPQQLFDETNSNLWHAVELYAKRGHHAGQANAQYQDGQSPVEQASNVHDRWPSSSMR
jgi:hypothetical protein